MPIDPKVLAELEKTDPELVQRYRSKMASSSEALASAQDAQDMGHYANLGGRALNDFVNSQKRDVVYKNRIQDLGKAPAIKEATRSAYDDSTISNITGQGVARAKDKYTKDSDAFIQEQRLTDLGIAREKEAKSNDPLSKESADAREYLKKVVPNAATMQGFDSLSEAQVHKISPSLFNAHNAEANRRSQEAYRREMAEQSRVNRLAAEAIRGAEKREKTSEKMEQLRVGDVGYAQTPDDAKQLKEAIETKKEFDAKLSELIELRKNKGVEYFDREAVARGKQLSNDLLLAYKNMAKLGVLSKSDEAIINAIIPADPLGQDWMPGQDATLHKLEKLKGDVESTYQNKLNNRLRTEGRNVPEPSAPPVRMQAPDGKIYSVPADKVDAAKEKGWK